MRLVRPEARCCKHERIDRDEVAVYRQDAQLSADAVNSVRSFSADRRPLLLLCSIAACHALSQSEQNLTMALIHPTQRLSKPA